MTEASPPRRRGENIIFLLAVIGFIALFLLMRRFDIVKIHRMQAFALVVGLGLAAESAMCLKDGRMDLRLNRRGREPKIIKIDGQKLKVVGAVCLLLGIAGVLWSLRFWVDAVPHMTGSQPATPPYSEPAARSPQR